MLWVFGLIIGLLIHGVISNAFKDAAEEKGYENNNFFWWVFLFGIIGMLLVIALPDKKSRYDYK